MKVKLKEALEKNNKTRYWLSMATDIAPPTIHKIYYNQTTSISFDVLEKICISLNCTPNDILEIEKDSEGE